MEGAGKLSHSVTKYRKGRLGTCYLHQDDLRELCGVSDVWGELSASVRVRISNILGRGSVEMHP
jgi:hypothetical protein